MGKGLSRLFFCLFTCIVTGCVNNTSRQEYALLRGINFSNNNEYFKAIKELEKSGSGIMAKRELAYCYGKVGDKEKALELYKEVLIQEPHDSVALRNIILIYYSNKNINEVKKYFSLLLSYEEDEKLLLIKGTIAKDENEYEEALRLLKKVRSKDRNIYEAIVKLSLQLGQKDELWKFLESEYLANIFRQDFVLIYSSVLENVFNEYSLSEKILLRYLTERIDDEVIIELAKNQYAQQKFVESKKIINLVSKSAKNSNHYIELMKKINAN